MSKIPLNLNEAIVAIAELQTKIDWLQGQSNLLLGFITASPENLRNFARFVKTVSETKEEERKEMRYVAQVLLDGGLSRLLTDDKFPPPNSGGSPLGPISPSPGANVIQFPKKP
ncbi:MAG TPA: hypothetical protein P5032_14910 [Candidatus Competibacter sp.]|nr:hypothetical protein [Candidatus Competibacter sp.]